MSGDIYHLTMAELLQFLGMCRDDFIRREGKLFPPLPRDSARRRYADIFQACDIYRKAWNAAPSRMYVGDFFYDIGIRDVEKSNVMMLRLISKGLIKE